jgi:hypothetical protein
MFDHRREHPFYGICKRTGCELDHAVADRLQRRRPGKEHWVILLSRPGEMVRRCEYARMVVFCLRDRLGKALDGVRQRRESRAVV